MTGVDDLEFETWPNQLGATPSVLTDAKSIFDAELDILQGAVVGGRVQVTCNQASLKYDYCGGELRFRLVSAELIDEGGKSCSIEELEALSKAYWEDWAMRRPS